MRLCSSSTDCSVVSRSSSISGSDLIKRASSPGTKTFLIAPVCGSGAFSDTPVTICAIFILPVCGREPAASSDFSFAAFRSAIPVNTRVSPAVLPIFAPELYFSLSSANTSSLSSGNSSLMLSATTF